MVATHVGRNITKLRELRGIKQEELAQMLGISQQAVSNLENKEEIDDETLAKIADKLGFTLEGIKGFNSEFVINSINQQGGNVYNINPLDKIIELYEKIILEKDQVIKLKDHEIEYLRSK